MTKFFLGTESLLTLVVIGYDRYNVIVKGMTGFKMTYGVALLVLLSTWIWVVLVSVPPFFGWGGYSLGKKINSYQLSQRVYSPAQYLQVL